MTSANATTHDVSEMLVRAYYGDQYVGVVGRLVLNREDKVATVLGFPGTPPVDLAALDAVSDMARKVCQPFVPRVELRMVLRVGEPEAIVVTGWPDHGRHPSDGIALLGVWVRRGWPDLFDEKDAPDPFPRGLQAMPTFLPRGLPVFVLGDAPAPDMPPPTRTVRFKADLVQINWDAIVRTAAPRRSVVALHVDERIVSYGYLSGGRFSVRGNEKPTPAYDVGMDCLLFCREGLPTFGDDELREIEQLVGEMPGEEDDVYVITSTTSERWPHVDRIDVVGVAKSKRAANNMVAKLGAGFEAIECHRRQKERSPISGEFVALERHGDTYRALGVPR